MKILYLSSSYIPSRRASSIQVMEMCSAFVEHGHVVTLVGKERTRDVEDDNGGPHSFYGLPPLFDVLALRRPPRRGGGLRYEVALARLLYRERHLWDLVYSRNLIGAWVATRMRLPVVFEAHELPPGRFGGTLLRRICRSESLLRLVSITDALRRDLEWEGFVPRRGDSVVAPSAVNPDKLGYRPRESSNISDSEETDGLQVGYIGNLYSGRGLEVIIELAHRLPTMTFHIVGGDEGSLARLRRQDLGPNVVLHGFVRPEFVGKYYDLFDVLLLPHQTRVMAASGRTDIARWCSPIKLFEYMAAGKAIVASDLPVLGEVLRDGENALIVPADDIEAWEGAIRLLAGNGQVRSQLGKTARRECLGQYTWLARAKTVLKDLSVGAEEHTRSDSLRAPGAKEFQGEVH